MHNTNKAANPATPEPPACQAGMPAQYLLESGGLLRLPQVLALVGVSKSTWWKLVREGRAPASVRLGDRCTCWHAAKVAAFIENAGKREAQA